MHVFLLCKYARVDPFMPYTWEDLFFMKKYMIWLFSIMMAVSMTACSNTAKKEETKQEQSASKDQAVNDNTTENKTTTEKKKNDKKDKKNDKNKDKKKDNKKNKKDNKNKADKTTKKNKTTTVKKKTATTSAKKTTTTHSQKVTTQEHKTTQEAKKEEYCEFLISCKTVLSHKDSLQSNYKVPSGGKIFEKKMKIEEGDTVMDVLKRTGVELDISRGYVAGIDGLYEFDCGRNSGWMYRVNRKFPNYMAGKCTLHDGDKVEWLYTCVKGDL